MTAKWNKNSGRLDFNEFLIEEILEKRSDLTPEDEEDCARALQFAWEEHIIIERQYRDSGEPVIAHLLEAAKIVSDCGASAEIIAAAILHDVVEDCERVTIETVASEFTENIAKIVDIVTNEEEQKFHNKLITELRPIRNSNTKKISKELRTAIAAGVVKLGDRLHNMRTLEHKKGDEKATKQEKLIRKADETVKIFLPVVRLFGIWQLETELGDLCLKYKYPEDYDYICTRLSDPDIVSKQRRIANSINNEFISESRLNATIIEHKKNPYFDIWRRKHGQFHDSKKIGQRYEIEESLNTCWLLVRVDTEETARKVNDFLAKKYDYLPERDKDTLKNPKDNEYRALHRTIRYVDEETGEVVIVKFMIRTAAHNKLANYGVLAYECYTTYDETQATKSQAPMEYVGKQLSDDNILRRVV